MSSNGTFTLSGLEAKAKELCHLKVSQVKKKIHPRAEEEKAETACFALVAFASFSFSAFSCNVVMRREFFNSGLLRELMMSLAFGLAKGQQLIFSYAFWLSFKLIYERMEWNGCITLSPALFLADLLGARCVYYKCTYMPYVIPCVHAYIHAYTCIHTYTWAMRAASRCVSVFVVPQAAFLVGTPSGAHESQPFDGVQGGKPGWNPRVATILDIDTSRF
jgi:hypothetical protein